MRLSPEHILTLQCTPGIGATSIERICLTPGPDLSGGKDVADLYEVLLDLINAKAVKRLSVPDLGALRTANGKAKRILEKNAVLGIGVVTRFDPTYPVRLLDTVDEAGKPAIPSLLFYKGNLSVADRPGLAVIGTRNPTDEGVAAGEYYARAFASIGVNIVSGLALGCDAAGHRGALSVGGATTAFVANGLDSVYPPENAGLAREIVDGGGLIMSEYPLGTPANRYNLVARDRLQAGLSGAVLVIQTTVKGGTMHAVRAAQSVGKPVFVVDFKDDLGDVVAGNIFLKKRENGGAVGLRATMDQIRSDKDKYLKILASKVDDAPLTLF